MWSFYTLVLAIAIICGLSFFIKWIKGLLKDNARLRDLATIRNDSDENYSDLRQQVDTANRAVEVMKLKRTEIGINNSSEHAASEIENLLLRSFSYTIQRHNAIVCVIRSCLNDMIKGGE